MISLFYVGAEFVKGWEKKEPSHSLPRAAAGLLLEPYLPGIRRMCQGDSLPAGEGGLWKALLAQYPMLRFAFKQGSELVSESDYAGLLPEGADEDKKGLPEEALDYGEDALHLEKGLASELKKENERYLNPTESAQEESGEGEPKEQPQQQESQAFAPAQGKSFQYQWEELTDYKELVKAFYAVDSATVAGEELLRVQDLLSKDMQLQGSADAPQILIYHTHSREGFADSVPGDENSGILGAGSYLASLLRERYGYNVIHNNECYDEERDYAYSNSLPAIERILAENPTIEAVIDLHRDEMPAERRLVMDLQGRPTAQFMFFNGLCRTRKGAIEQLENPYLADNLAFSFQLQAACNEYYPGIARRIYLKAYRYNMHLAGKSLLVELGAQNNTEEEIKNACEPLAHVLDLVLSGAEPARE